MKAGSDLKTKKLYRSQTDRMLAGVCGGISAYFELDSTLIRLLILTSAFIGGIGLIIYLSAILLVPNNPDEEAVKEKQTDFDYKFMIVGFILVTIGFFLLFKGFPLAKIWYFFWQYAWALFLIIGGIYLLFYQRVNRTSFTITIRKSVTNKMLGGVCAGLADHFQIDASIVRILWIIGTIITAGVGLLVYLILMIVMPEKTDTES
jgi:phage shock protein C